MNHQYQTTLAPVPAQYDRLAEVLSRIPEELLPQVDARAAIFVAGMEAALQLQRPKA